MCFSTSFVGVYIDPVTDIMNRSILEPQILTALRTLSLDAVGEHGTSGGDSCHSLNTLLSPVAGDTACPLPTFLLVSDVRAKPELNIRYNSPCLESDLARSGEGIPWWPCSYRYDYDGTSWDRVPDDDLPSRKCFVVVMTMVCISPSHSQPYDSQESPIYHLSTSLPATFVRG